MKIGSYAANAVPKINIFVPCQTLLIEVVHPADPVLTASDSLQSLSSVLVRLQNSKTGSKTDIIPHIKLAALAEIATYNEGCVLMSDNKVLYPVMLNPVGNVDLDNDKFLEVELNIAAGTTVNVYAYSASTMSSFVTKYEKLTVPAGTSRQSFNVQDLELIMLPNFMLSFDSIRLTYKNSSVVDLSNTELKYHMAKTNDITVVKGLGNSGVLASGFSLVTSHNDSAILNLVDVQSIEIIRDNMAVLNSYEVITGNFR